MNSAEIGMWAMFGFWLVTFIIATVIMEKQRDEIKKLRLELHQKDFEFELASKFMWARKP